MPSSVAFTVTSPMKPCAVALFSSPVAAAAGSSVAVASSAGAAARLFSASTTAVEVIVAPLTASTSLPSSTGSVLPINCFVKSSSEQF